MSTGVELAVSPARETALEAAVEARTQAYGRRLLERLQLHRRSWLETVQDEGLVLLSDDARWRRQLLRLVDVLPSLEPGRDDRLLWELARELLGPVAGALPASLALALRGALSGVVPVAAFAVLARTVVQQMGQRFIVPSGREGTRRVLHELRAAGRMATFDVLGEAVVGERQAAAYANRYLDLIDALAGDPDAGRDSPGRVRRLQVSLKLSALTPHFDPADPPGTLRRLREPLARILHAARRAGVAVTWDLEQYAFRELTWWLFQQLYRPGQPLGDWDGAGVVVQAYLRDSHSLVDEVIAFARRRGVPFQVRLVKGAYWDYETITAGAAHWPIPVFEQKWQTDAQYERLARMLLEAWPHVYTAAGSHNVRSLAHAAAVAEVLGLPPEAVEYQTLYGMDPAISQAIRDVGWLARDYVPSGDLLGGMAYLVRRLLENTSQVGFLRQSRADLDPDVLLASPLPASTTVHEPALTLTLSAAKGKGKARGKGKGSPQTTGGRAIPASTEAVAGFVPVPPVRLFDAGERERFAAALAGTRREWGQTVPLRIDGGRVTSTAAPLVSTSPSYPDPAAPVAVVQAADLDATALAIRTANASASGWAARAQTERNRVLRRAADLLLAERDELAAWIVHEGGKNWTGALADVDEAIDYLRYYPAQAERLGADYRPRGVVAVIPPWNFPVAIPCGMTAAALVTGNTVILKSAEQTPFVAECLVDVLHRAGVPQDALIHLPGVGETVGQALVASPDVDMIAFTGSRDVGRHIAATAAGVRLTGGGIKHVVAEMGGKNPILVFADADLEEAAAGILTSAFSHAGQKCSAASRVFVERPVFDRLTALLVDGAQSLPLGPADAPGTVINPVIDDAARRGIVRWAGVARQEGRVLLDPPQGPRTPGLLLGPLLVAMEKEDAFKARTAQEEIFGPVLPIIPFDAEAEAVEMANATSYGLTAGIFTRSPARAGRVAKGIRAGNVYVNREITGARVGVEPFGGVWLSGTGPKAGGPDYLYAFVTRRPVPKQASASGGFGGALLQRPAGTRRPVPKQASASSGATTDVAPHIDAGPVETVPDPGIVPWNVTPLERAEAIARAGRALRSDRPDLLDALHTGYGLHGLSGAHTAARLRERTLTLVMQVPEVAEVEPTYPVPGQRTTTSWATPRGTGLVVADDPAPPIDLVTLLIGALLAGNGIVAVPSPTHRPLAEILVRILVESGVPPASVRCVASPGTSDEASWYTSALALAGGPIAFAGAALEPDALQDLAHRLASPWPGQRWIKALITLDDGPAPGETGFLRRFALPKTIAVRTVRHGADLGPA